MAISLKNLINISSYAQSHTHNLNIYTLSRPLVDELLRAAEHPLENAARSLVFRILHIVQLKAMDSTVGLAPSFLAATLEGVDGNVGNFEGHLDLFYLVGGSTDVVVLV